MIVIRGVGCVAKAAKPPLFKKRLLFLP